MIPPVKYPYNINIPLLTVQMRKLRLQEINGKDTKQVANNFPTTSQRAVREYAQQDLQSILSHKFKEQLLCAKQCAMCFHIWYTVFFSPHNKVVSSEHDSCLCVLF